MPSVDGYNQVSVKSSNFINQRSLWLLALGVAAGIVLTVISLFTNDSGVAKIDDKTIAIVNNVAISQFKYQLLLNAIKSGSKKGENARYEKRLLDKLIEEELLVQRAIEIGLTKSDKAVRAALIQSIMQVILSESKSQLVNEETILHFYQENQSYFEIPEQLHIRHLRIDSDHEGAARNAALAANALRNGELFHLVKEKYGQPTVVNLPDTLLPLKKIRDYLETTLVDTIYSMQPGDISEPIQDIGGNHHIIQLVKRVNGQQKPIEFVREQVEEEYRHRAEEQVLRDYLDWLRQRAEITTSNLWFPYEGNSQ